MIGRAVPVCAIAAAILQLSGEQAFSYVRNCHAPDEPYCITGYGTFESDYSFNTCKSDLENYRTEVEDFLSCQKRAANELIDEYNEAVRKFNCRAKGQSYC